MGAFLLGNLFTAMAARGLLPDLGFLGQAAGFEIGEHVIPYAPSDTYGQALLVGLLNTLIVSALGIVLPRSLGLLVGIARLSRNWLVAARAGYVELFRNTPLLVQLLSLLRVFLQLPPVRDSIALPGESTSTSGASTCRAPSRGAPWRRRGSSGRSCARHGRRAVARRLGAPRARPAARRWTALGSPWLLLIALPVVALARAAQRARRLRAARGGALQLRAAG